MSQQAQIDALEHLVRILINNNGNTLHTSKIFEKARESVMSEKTLGGSVQKTEAASYLDHLQTTWYP